MVQSYEHIFFDLDHTLWDHEKNSEETLKDLYYELGLVSYGIRSFSSFFQAFVQINAAYWKRYRNNQTSKEELRTLRFKDTFLQFGCTDKHLVDQISKKYLAVCPKKQNVCPFAFEVLDYLNGKYKLHVITNGFREVQFIKLQNSSLLKYFDQVIVSEDAGYLKPHPQIFVHSLNRVSAKPGHSMMVGDNLEADILGAKQAGLDQVYFNPKKKDHAEDVTYEITCLSELMEFL